MLLLWTGLLFGFFGSLHCLGMCAPLLWAMPQPKSKRTVWWRNKLAYNIGRTMTYMSLGLLVGLIGESMVWAGFQQYLSIATGVLMLFFLIFSKGSIPQSFHFRPIQQIMLRVKSALGRLIQGNTLQTNLIMGLYNGLLPCGLVYMALLASLSMSSLTGSALYMVVFGLGTFPMMIIAAYFGSSVRQWNQKLISNWIPRFIFIVALLLIARGLNLGIPYLSPKISSSENIVICETPQ